MSRHIAAWDQFLNGIEAQSVRSLILAKSGRNVRHAQPDARIRCARARAVRYFPRLLPHLRAG
jgi:hypothetical protein